MEMITVNYYYYSCYKINKNNDPVISPYPKLIFQFISTVSMFILAILPSSLFLLFHSSKHVEEDPVFFCSVGSLSFLSW